MVSFQYWTLAITHLSHVEIMSNPERISNLRKIVDNCGWSGLEFPVAIKGISKFKKKNDIIINILGVEEKRIYMYIPRVKKHDEQMKVVNLLLIAHGERRHYTTIKDLSKLVEVVIVGKNINNIFV